MFGKKEEECKETNIDGEKLHCCVIRSQKPLILSCTKKEDEK